MKKKVMIICSIFFSMVSFAQVEQIHFKYGTVPVIDGNFDAGEWDDADSISIDIIGTSFTTKVFYKHDGKNLNMVFVGHMLANPDRYPEILFDTDNSKSDDWESDDWWFHVSNGDCYYKGAYGNYNNCKLSQEDWKAKNNFQYKPQFVEFMIPFETIGIKTTDTIGISFLTNDFKVFNIWPSFANNLKPSTWAIATFDKPVSILDKVNKEQPKLYPNPVKRFLNIESDFIKNNSQIEIFDSRGVLQRKLESSSFKTMIDLQELPTGIYLLKIRSEDGMVVKKFIKAKS